MQLEHLLSPIEYGAPQTLPALFISHGAPARALQTPGFVHALQRLGRNLPKPRAIVVLSAHWQAATLAVSSHPKPATWHDFGPIDPAAYDLRYEAPGAPHLAEYLAELLRQAGLTCALDPLRPRDHGVWMPLLHLYPEAQIPVIQIALPQTWQASQVYFLGQTVRALRDAQILLIGSGSITHNLQTLDWHQPATTQPVSIQFRQWIQQQLEAGHLERLLDWQHQAPAALENHPTPEHLMPLFFAAGAGHRMSVVHESTVLGGLGMDIYRFD